MKKVLRKAIFATITVPDLPGYTLIAKAKKVLDLNYSDKDFFEYDFLRDDRGKTYEIMVWKPGRDVVPAEDVRAYFKERDFHGNSAAFVAWVIKHNPEGHHATIPEDDRLFRNGIGGLSAPLFIRADGCRTLHHSENVRNRWLAYWAFVAFREIHS